MSKRKSLLPTYTSSIGMLLGGLAGLACGSFWGNEIVVMACFTAGFLAGSAIGAMLGYRWIARNSPSKTDLSATKSLGDQTSNSQ